MSRGTSAGMSAGWLPLAALLTYPLLVYAALHWLPLDYGAWVLLALYTLLLLVRLRAQSAEVRSVVTPHVPLLAMIAAAIGLGERRILMLLPVLVNLYLLLTFARTLWRGPPLIERFARMIEGDLPAFTHPYCRKLTQLWCVFFLANALWITYLAWAAPLEWWTLYTGVGCYLVLALLQGTEFLVRKLWFRYYNGGPVDRLLERLFPAARTPNGRRSLAYQAARRAEPLQPA